MLPAHGNMQNYRFFISNDFVNEQFEAQGFCHNLPFIMSIRRNLWLSSLLQVMNGAILQQVFVVEFVIQSQMCDDCHRVEAKDFWKAVVQVRQKVSFSGLLRDLSNNYHSRLYIWLLLLHFREWFN